MTKITSAYLTINDISDNIKKIYNHLDILLCDPNFDFEIEYKKIKFDSHKIFSNPKEAQLFIKEKKRIIKYIISDTMKKLVKACFEEIDNYTALIDDERYSPVYIATGYLRHLLSQDVDYSQYEMKIISEAYEVNREKDIENYLLNQSKCRAFGCNCEIKDCNKCDDHHEHQKQIDNIRNRRSCYSSEEISQQKATINQIFGGEFDEV